MLQEPRILFFRFRYAGLTCQNTMSTAVRRLMALDEDFAESIVVCANFFQIMCHVAIALTPDHLALMERIPRVCMWSSAKAVDEVEAYFLDEFIKNLLQLDIDIPDDFKKAFMPYSPFMRQYLTGRTTDKYIIVHPRHIPPYCLSPALKYWSSMPSTEYPFSWLPIVHGSYHKGLKGSIFYVYSSYAKSQGLELGFRRLDPFHPFDSFVAARDAGMADEHIDTLMRMMATLPRKNMIMSSWTPGFVDVLRGTLQHEKYCGVDVDVIYRVLDLFPPAARLMVLCDISCGWLARFMPMVNNPHIVAMLRQISVISTYNTRKGLIMNVTYGIPMMYGQKPTFENLAIINQSQNAIRSSKLRDWFKQIFNLDELIEYATQKIHQQGPRHPEIGRSTHIDDLYLTAHYLFSIGDGYFELPAAPEPRRQPQMIIKGLPTTMLIQIAQLLCRQWFDADYTFNSSMYRAFLDRYKSALFI